MSSATSETSDFLPFNPALSTKPKALRNMKRLSLTLPSAQSSSSSLALPPPPEAPQQIEPPTGRLRRPSVASLPVLHRREEDGGSPTAPYADGPIQILPGIWLGSEDNAKDYAGLIQRGIKAILNVAKEVASPFDAASAQPIRPFASTPNLSETMDTSRSTYYPPHVPTGRPGMHYLKLHWSHGQSDLIQQGFPAAMQFVDQALERNEGVLIHCQCGISRSATIVIALVMRAAATSSPHVSPEVWELKGYHAAYEFVKNKSKHVGPNMSLIYQLLDYERTLRPGNTSPTPSDKSSDVAELEEEWGRRRQMMEAASSDTDDDWRDNIEVAREARALDKAMEDRILARKASASSTSSGGLGMGLAWKTRYGGRRRTASIASNLTNGSILSEDLVEEDEEAELLGVGGGFDDKSPMSRASSAEPEDLSDPREGTTPFTPMTARPLRTPRPPPSAPAHKTAFVLPPPPATAIRATFDLPSRGRFGAKPRRRPAPLAILPPVPSSPEAPPSAKGPPITTKPPQSAKPAVPTRLRTESRRPTPPPLFLRSLSNEVLPINKNSPQTQQNVNTPSQTLFVFPPSPTPTARTPSTMTLMSHAAPVPFPLVSPPKVSTVRAHGRTRSFIGLGVPPTPTTACSRVDARGWFGGS
ncbi:hypothetical protein PUNSTDRAFT_59759 [Punctularia strigosozonata HHB-11173 SS5]|uniref:uncharacterized protein n=1 Tax=Punctularia strigosozonata (strain HHB-11173) TaxID=741275 RepID=UPI0004416F99|nr:uncharacterized protein PUNSTDRAFT_59759 [Punctularia strigosozonata HHB-11173 SS5]EIN13549.1 hypothetical protein PUNSTDRAFT_59759 [Punctularia strigosozonata HHB-11173 SS5]